MRPALWRARRSPTPSGSRIPLPNPSWNRIRGGGKRERGAGPLSLSYSDQGRGGGRGPSWAAPSVFHYGLYGPYLSPGGSGNPSRTPVCTRYTPEPFRCLNTTFQYINLYLSTISRLLVMSVTSSGTPNKLRFIKTHNSYNTYCH